MKKGFTLIELLVVVLIIGILAAVALPQYQVAADKARLAEILVNLKTIRQASDAYFLANGSRPLSFEDIDVSFPGMTLLEDEGLPNSLILLPNGNTYFLDVDGYIGARTKNHNLGFINYWYVPCYGETKGCYVWRTPTDRGKRLGKSLGRFLKNDPYSNEIYEICP